MFRGIVHLQMKFVVAEFNLDLHPCPLCYTRVEHRGRQQTQQRFAKYIEFMCKLEGTIDLEYRTPEAYITHISVANHACGRRARDLVIDEVREDQWRLGRGVYGTDVVKNICTVANRFTKQSGRIEIEAGKDYYINLNCSEDRAVLRCMQSGFREQVNRIIILGQVSPPLALPQASSNTEASKEASALQQEAPAEKTNNSKAKPKAGMNICSHVKRSHKDDPVTKKKRTQEKAVAEPMPAGDLEKSDKTVSIAKEAKEEEPSPTEQKAKPSQAMVQRQLSFRPKAPAPVKQENKLGLQLSEISRGGSFQTSSRTNQFRSIVLESCHLERIFEVVHGACSRI